MPIFKINPMPLMYQKSNGVCWYASARMLYTWARATKRGAMTNPADDTGYFTRYMNNGDVEASQNWHIAQQFNMKKHDTITMDYATVNDFLVKHGPIWTGLQKNWDNFNHGHVVVICGVADTGVFVHDPEPVRQGSTFWLTWGQIHKAINGVSPSPQFLTAV